MSVGKEFYEKVKNNNPYFEDLITRSVYHSNAIEGNTLSFAETYSLIFSNDDLNIKVNADAREIYETINLKYAFNIIFENIDEPITLDLIKKIGIQINKNINEIDDFRKTNVMIKGAEHIPPQAYDVPRLFNELLYDRKKDNEDIFTYIARFHIAFERIHPFSDGNGRIGRILIIKELISSGEVPIVIKKEDRAEYFKYLENQDIDGMAKFFEKLNEDEKERMKKFDINWN